MKQRFAVYDLIVDGVIVYVGIRNRAFMHELEELLKQEQ